MDSQSISKHLYILGTGVLAEEFFALVRHADGEVAAFVENLDPAKAGTTLCGRPIIWVDDLPAGSACICALSTTKRERFIDQVRGRAEFVGFVHPSAVILPGTTLGAGTVVSTGVLIASNTAIGEHVFVNRGASIGHHTRIADFVTIQPHASVGGQVRIGSHSYIGMSAVVIERLSLGSGVTVAAGAVVLHDVPDRVMVAGVPAAIKKRDIDAR